MTDEQNRQLTEATESCEQCKGTGQYMVDDGSGEHPIDKQCSLCEGTGKSNGSQTAVDAFVSKDQ